MKKLEKKILITGTIEAVSGIMIGGSNNSMSIGLPDKMVIRNPMDNKPYIPGSTIKGKMRSLLELSYGYVKAVNMGKVKNGPADDPNFITTVLFGNSIGDTQQQPSRIICRDAKLLNGDEIVNTDLPFTEAKTEVVIDRITSAAMPRTMERVPAGAIFNLELVLNVFTEDKFNSKELLDLIYKGMSLIQDDYLGGGGSRGNGRVSLRSIKLLNDNTANKPGRNKSLKFQLI
ncbi:MAG: type III-A CRISPR-associated RAMP protein Csm3 [Bacteroidetes bacterium]|nr:type III-A CRISPR-associated RAMP protein Csm3 [Bacteroidota bacterium]